MSDIFKFFDDFVSSTVLSFLTPFEVILISNVSTHWRHSCFNEVVWKLNCKRDLGLDAPRIPNENTLCDSFKETWITWFKIKKSLGLSVMDVNHYERVLNVWDRLEKWTSKNIPRIYSKLNEGATKKDINKLESELDVKIPDLIRMIWGIHNGQPPSKSYNDYNDGLFGGYNYYNHEVCLRMNDTNTILMYTKELRTYFRNHKGLKNYLVLFSTYRPMQKMVLYDTETGGISIRSVSCTPAIRVDSLLQWMEEYAERLHSGLYVPYPLRPFSDVQAINLYPQYGVGYSKAVTRGIEIEASVLFVPEDTNSVYTYSVRMKLVSVEDLGYPSAQLTRRHWVIKNGYGLSDEVRGDAVVGRTPVLYAGGYRDKTDDGEVVEREGQCFYQSCTGDLSVAPGRDGEFGGFIYFVPGTIAKPLGPEFAAVVAPFTVSTPSFIY